jgi:hypothetical protein
VRTCCGQKVSVSGSVNKAHKNEVHVHHRDLICWKLSESKAHRMSARYHVIGNEEFEFRLSRCWLGWAGLGIRLTLYVVALSLQPAFGRPMPSGRGDQWSAPVISCTSCVFIRLLLSHGLGTRREH